MLAPTAGLCVVCAMARYIGAESWSFVRLLFLHAWRAVAIHSLVPSCRTPQRCPGSPWAARAWWSLQLVAQECIGCMVPLGQLTRAGLKSWSVCQPMAVGAHAAWCAELGAPCIRSLTNRQACADHPRRIAGAGVYHVRARGGRGDAGGADDARPGPHPAVRRPCKGAGLGLQQE